jgi:molecular chaperone GrpE
MEENKRETTDGSSEEEELIKNIDSSQEDNDQKEKIKDIPFEVTVNESDLSTGEFSLNTEQISKKLEGINEQIIQLSNDFQTKLKYDSHKEKIIDNLHRELQEYKEDLLGKLMRPIFMDVIDVIDDVGKILKNLRDKESLNDLEKLKKIAIGIPEDLEDVLYKHGVDIIETEDVGFNPSLQKVLKVIPTNQKDLDKTICEKIKNGYRWNDKLIRHEMVSVYRFRASEEDQKENNLPRP